MDWEKVINDFAKWCDEMEDECPVICLDSLAMLKEQEAEIKRLKGELHGFGDLFHTLSEKTKEVMAEQPEIVRCRECKWWDKKAGSNFGYCHACKHGYYSDHWEIGIYRTYKGDWFCADGERKEDR